MMLFDYAEARRIDTEMNARLDVILEMINTTYTSNTKQIIKHRLNVIEHDVMMERFGGYAREHREQLIARIDSMLEMIDEVPPVRSEAMFSYVPQPRTMFSSSATSKSLTVPLFREVRDESYQQDICVICFVPFYESDKCKPTYLGCKHRFHEPCIIRWAMTKHECPVCKQDMHVL